MKSSKTVDTIHQLFVGRLEAENGQIKLLRESINLVELGLAIYTNGLADYKAPDLSVRKSSLSGTGPRRLVPMRRTRIAGSSTPVDGGSKL